MEKHEKMRYRLAESLKQLMKEHPLDKITVSDIVRGCDVSRQSFYRLFQDKYDLVNWYFERLAQQSFKQMGKTCSLREGLIRKFRFIQQEHVFFYQAFSSQDSNSLMNYDVHCIYEFYKNLIEEKNSSPLDEEMCFLLEMYCHGSLVMTVRWVKEGMPQPVEEIVALLIKALPERLKEQLSHLLCDR